MTESNFNNVFAKAYEIHLANPNLLTVYDSVTKNWTCPDNWSFGNSIWNAGTMIFSLGFRFTAPVTFGAMDFKIFLNPPIRAFYYKFKKSNLEMKSVKRAPILCILPTFWRPLIFHDDVLIG